MTRSLPELVTSLAPRSPFRRARAGGSPPPGAPDIVQRVRDGVRARPTKAFIVLAFGFSWAAWVPQLAAVQGWLSMRPWSGLHLLGGLGPAAAAMVVISCTEGRAGLRSLGRRLIAWRGRGRAWTFALLVPPLLLAVAIPLSMLAGDSSWSQLNWSAFGRTTEFASLPLAVWWIVNLGFYGVGEELGWRGFLQPRLEQHHSTVAAAGLVSLPWALWHLPLFGITPSYRAMPLVGFLGFAASIWVASWIFAWLLHLGRGSLFVVAVFHSWFDIVTTSPLGPQALPMMMGGAITVLGLVLLRRMLREPSVQKTPEGGEVVVASPREPGNAPH